MELNIINEITIYIIIKMIQKIELATIKIKINYPLLTIHQIMEYMDIIETLILDKKLIIKLV